MEHNISLQNQLLRSQKNPQIRSGRPPYEPSVSEEQVARAEGIQMGGKRGCDGSTNDDGAKNYPGNRMNGRGDK